MKLKKYTMEQLSKVKVVLNESELNILKGGYTDLHNGYVKLTFDEMFSVFGHPSNWPDYIITALGYNAMTIAHAASEFNLRYGNSTFEVAAEDLGFFAEIWCISSSNVSDTEMARYQHLDLAYFIVDILHDVDSQTTYSISSTDTADYIAAIYDAIVNKGYTTRDTLEYTLNIDFSKCIIKIWEKFGGSHPQNLICEYQINL